MKQILKINGGGPAFPFVLTFPAGSTLGADDGSSGVLEENRTEIFPGMTLRQWYAAMALQGIYASCPQGIQFTTDKMPLEDWATVAFAQADAMLEHEKLYPAKP